MTDSLLLTGQVVAAVIAAALAALYILTTPKDI